MTQTDCRATPDSLQTPHRCIPLISLGSRPSTFSISKPTPEDVHHLIHTKIPSVWHRFSFNAPHALQKATILSEQRGVTPDSSLSSRPESTPIVGLQTIPSLPLPPHYEPLRTWPPPHQRYTPMGRGGPGDATKSTQIVNPTLPPRRVLESEDSEWYWNCQILPVWMDEMDHVNVRTPVDEYKWPVPALSALS
ncbi:hypothetical protein ARMSODRAFT_1022332 [Armillaria solidipes]|uniref:Uncharacterized protein n=1 Tax=Armillaria solidipes TaxID=1076256 RepID=A0A2H3BLV1_9AGAR|nr:hypothetical protein ARMSODRAFT_1022332 [Armillaria solidipes]